MSATYNGVFLVKKSAKARSAKVKRSKSAKVKVCIGCMHTVEGLELWHEEAGECKKAGCQNATTVEPPNSGHHRDPLVCPL